MTIQASLPLIVTVVGGLVYGLLKQPKLSELGRLAFAVGLLALLIRH